MQNSANNKQKQNWHTQKQKFEKHERVKIKKIQTCQSKPALQKVARVKLVKLALKQSRREAHSFGFHREINYFKYGIQLQQPFGQINEAEFLWMFIRRPDNVKQNNHDFKGPINIIYFKINNDSAVAILMGVMGIEI